MNSKKLRFARICRYAMWIMPWLVLVPGIPAIKYFAEGSRLYREAGTTAAYLRASELFDMFYNFSMYSGAVIVVLELLVSVTGLICLVKTRISKEKYNFWDVVFCPWMFVFGTLLLMFFVHTFTYGMGI